MFAPWLCCLRGELLGAPDAPRTVRIVLMHQCPQALGRSIQSRHLFSLAGEPKMGVVRRVTVRRGYLLLVPRPIVGRLTVST